MYKVDHEAAAAHGALADRPLALVMGVTGTGKTTVGALLARPSRRDHFLVDLPGQTIQAGLAAGLNLAACRERSTSLYAAESWCHTTRSGN